MTWRRFKAYFTDAEWPTFTVEMEQTRERWRGGYITDDQFHDSIGVLVRLGSGELTVAQATEAYKSIYPVLYV